MPAEEKVPTDSDWSRGTVVPRQESLNQSDTYPCWNTASQAVTVTIVTIVTIEGQSRDHGSPSESSVLTEAHWVPRGCAGCTWQRMSVGLECQTLWQQMRVQLVQPQVTPGGVGHTMEGLSVSHLQISSSGSVAPA